MKTLFTLLLLTTMFGYSQTTECCDSLMKMLKCKTGKTICRKPTTGQNRDITICIDNSHSANNYSPAQGFKLDTINKPCPCPPNTIEKPSDDGFKWWNDLWKPLIQLLIALVPLFILVFKYLTQKEKEFKEKIIEHKRIAYSEFLDNFTEVAVKIMHDKNVDTIKDDRERLFARNKLLLYANDKVILAYNNWVNYADNDGKSLDKEGDLIGKIFIEIRKDIHGDSILNEKDISNLNPFERG
jgi:hypothetical protein